MPLGRFLGLRRKFTVDGVRYREIAPEPRRSARHTSRAREDRAGRLFDVIFPDGAIMRIAASPQRVFADLTGDSMLDPYRAVQQRLRPGMRMIILEGGTGAVGQWAARIVGSAGAVVSLDRDQQSIDYAQHRYRLSNVSYEHGWIDALKGETDSAFDAAIAIDAFRIDDHGESAAAELWRVVGSGGVLILGAALEPSIHAPGHPQSFTPERLATLLEQAISSGSRPEQVSIFRRGGRTYAIARRPDDEP